MNFVQVAIPSPLRQTFTYINNSGSDLLGKRVLVEFGRRKLVGIVTDKSDIADGKYKLKNIIEVLDETPLFSTEAIKKIIYISEHYMHPLGVVIESFIPTFPQKS
jgi:primosomal protein N' (replication factor Y)